jgi:hypothetical protein
MNGAGPALVAIGLWVFASLVWGRFFGEAARERREHLREERQTARRRCRARVEEEV